MHTRYISSVVALSIAFAVTASSATHFERDPVFLYQPDEPLRARLGSAQDLVAYIKRLQAAGTAFFASEQTPEKLDVVVGLKPGRKVRVWLISSRRTNKDKTLQILRKKLETIPPCSVHAGPVAFALRWMIAGASTGKEELFKRPIPKEWRDAGGKDVLVPDGIFDRIWRE
jgi:hypothetical protein